MLKKKNVKPLIITVAIVLFLIFFLFATALIVSFNYAGFYDTPKVSDAQIDMTNVDIKNTRSINLYGEWEFYYNKWIVTDNYIGGRDALIDLPKMWTGMEVDGKKLPKTGYASYKLTLLNLPKGSELYPRLYVNENAYRVYANGKLIVEQGELSKETNKGYIDSDPYFDTLKVDNGEKVEIVIEITANSLGGLTDAPGIMVQADSAAAGAWIFDMPTVGFGIMVALVAMSLIMCVSVFKESKDISLFLLLLSILLYYCYVKDGFFMFIAFTEPSPLDIYIGNIVTSCFVNIAAVYYLKKNKTININNKTFALFGGIFTLSALTQGLLLGTMYQVIPLTIILATTAYVMYLCAKNIVKARRFVTITDMLTYSFVILLQCFLLLENLGITVQGMETYPFIGTMLIMVVTNMVYLFRMRKNAKLALQSVTLSKEIGDIKNEALRAQIKPHFVFNTLTSIQNLYHKSIELGDEGLTCFSRHLRLNIDSDTNGMVAFDNEMENVLNYFDLENMRQDQKYQLLFDIEFSDYELPILSLQPLIENAIKYSNVNNREDGYIQIKSALAHGDIIISVIDNGDGFDVAKIRQNAKGLKNITERLKYALNADVIISSELGVGTEITIKFPHTNDIGDTK